MSGSASVNILQPFTPQQLQQAAAATQAYIANSDFYSQPIVSGSGTFAPLYGQGQTVTINPTNIGIITKFTLELTVTINNPANGAQLTRTPAGPSNALSNITYTDPAQYNRISTSGRHLYGVTCRRHRRIVGAALTTDSPTGFGSTLAPIAAPSTIAPGASATVNMIYEIPLRYGRGSFDGAVFAGASFITQQLQFTFNPLFAQSGNDPLQAVYTGASAANPPTYSVAYKVTQDYYAGAPDSLIAALDPPLSTIYELKNTIISPVIAGAENYVRYTNLRKFLSTMIAYDNGGTMNAGSDISQIRLLTANQTPKWTVGPNLLSYRTRNRLGDDFPDGFYMIDESEAPIITAAEGNTLLGITPITANAGALIEVGWESLGVAAVLASAPSLAGTAGR